MTLLAFGLLGIFLFVIIASGHAQKQTTESSVYLPAIVDGRPFEFVPRPDDYAALIAQNVEAGIWTEGQGIVQVLRLFNGELTTADVPGANTVQRGEGLAVGQMAQGYLEDGSDPAIKAEIARLELALFPPLDNLLAYAEPAPGAERMASASYRIPDNDFCIGVWQDGLPLEGELEPCHYKTTEYSGLTRIHIYYPKEWEDTSYMARVTAAEQAAKDAIPTYEPLFQEASDRMPDLHLIFSPVPNPDNPTDGLMRTYQPSTAAERGYKDGIGEQVQVDCPVILWTAATEGLSINNFKQSLAHELFHCFQLKELTSKMDHENYVRSKWWAEGTAEYFSNVVYPTYDFEHRWQEIYNYLSADTALMELENSSYGTVFFWQHMANAIGDEGVMSILRDMPDLPSTVRDQAQALAGFPNIADEFHKFGHDFFDGKIIDTSGIPIPSDTLPLLFSSDAATPRYFEAEGESREHSAHFFTLVRYPLGYADNKFFMQSYELFDAQHSVKILYNSQFLPEISPGEPWDELVTDVTTGCEEPADFFLLLTTTDYDKQAQDHIQVQIGEVIDRQCYCYFDVTFGGAVSAFYTSPGFYEINTIPFPALRILGFGDTFLTAADVLNYPAEELGDFPLSGFAFADNPNGVVIGTYGESDGGVVTITESNDQFIEGRMRGTLTDASPSGEAGTVSLTAHFRAARTLSEEANICDTYWENY
jgi:hypothetical protein